MTKMTYTMVKAMVNDLYEHQLFWEKMADTYRPFSYRWQECTDMAKDYANQINEIFAKYTTYRTMWNLELTRKAAR